MLEGLREVLSAGDMGHLRELLFGHRGHPQGFHEEHDEVLEASADDLLEFVVRQFVAESEAQLAGCVAVMAPVDAVAEASELASVVLHLRPGTLRSGSLQAVNHVRPEGAPELAAKVGGVDELQRVSLFCILPPSACLGQVGAARRFQGRRVYEPAPSTSTSRHGNGCGSQMDQAGTPTVYERPGYCSRFVANRSPVSAGHSPTCSRRSQAGR